MSETPEHQIETTPIPGTQPTEPAQRPNRLNTVAAWVGIVAGVVFIVAVVFFSGFALGKQAGDGPRGDHFRGAPGAGAVHRGGPPPMFESGPRGGFERPMPPGGPGQQQPGAPTTTSPTTPERP